VLDDVVDALMANPAVVLQAPPGAGKSTRLPLALLEAPFAQKGRILMLEPRRVAARSVAQTLAKNRGCRLGDEIGYHIRFERKFGTDTRLVVMTEGILGRRLVDDPLLEGTSVVILDEFHERSLHADLALAFLKESLSVRDDLKVVVMSATLKMEAIGHYLSDAPTVFSEGRAFPLAIAHQNPEPDESLPRQVTRALRGLMLEEDDDGGDILVFLPGKKSIVDTITRIAQRPLPGKPEVLPFYGALSTREQDRVFEKHARRRVVLATNIAETSLTIDGVKAVVDSGFVNELWHRPATGLDRLETRRVSRDSATQRSGRAGRLAPGRVVRLWSKAEDALFAAHTRPEIARVDLSGALLSVLAFHPGDPRTFDFLESPPPAHLERSLGLLSDLGLIDADMRLTPRGKGALNLPLSPRLGALMVEAVRRGQAELGAQICALLSERDPSGADLETLLDEKFHGSQRQRGGDAGLFRVADQVQRLAERRLGSQEDGVSDAPIARTLGSLLLHAFPDRVCMPRQSGGHEALMVGGRVVKVPRERPAPTTPFLALVATEDGKSKSGAVWVRLAHPISLAAIKEALGNLVVVEESAIFDPDAKKVRGYALVKLHDLVIEKKDGVAVAPAVVEEALAREAAARFEHLWGASPLTENIRARALLAQTIHPELDWPDWSREALEAMVPGLCRGKKSLDDVARTRWSTVLDAALPWECKRILQTEFPATFELPTGRQAGIDYEPALQPGGAPVLAARVQEFFGLKVHPHIAQGRIALRLSLLAPNQRPAQVTEDLPGFWAGSYAEVRKDLRRRYPKHSWPDNPAEAKPESRPQRKRKGS
jgi:ATP-dependent helicase HrpB